MRMVGLPPLDDVVGGKSTGCAGEGTVAMPSGTTPGGTMPIGPVPVIRLAVVADVPAIERIVHDAYVKYVARIGRPPGPMLDDYAARVAAGEVAVCVDGDAIAGILVLEAAADHLLLDNIAVAPAWQGRGVWRML